MGTPKVNDPLTPAHYPDSRHGDIIHVCFENDLGFCEGNVIKYVTRWKKKGGVEDLLKAKVYLNRLIRHAQSKNRSD